MKKVIFTLLLLTLSTSYLFSQKETYNWCFGNHALMSFKTTPPQISFIGFSWSAYEGCASISDGKGNLLFYTDGINIHSVSGGVHYNLANGKGLNGSNSSTQVGVIIKHPGKPNWYYIFTTDEEGGNKGLQYTVVDVSKYYSGKIDVAYSNGNYLKNILINKSSTEKITAVAGKERNTYWIIMHEWNNNTFCAYKFDANGIDINNPVKSSIGSIHEFIVYPPNAKDTAQYHSHGYMKVSPDGTTLALSIFHTNKVEVFRFDNSTGKVSSYFGNGNDFIIDDPKFFNAYGIEFSPNTNNMYISTIDKMPYRLFQVNLSKITDQSQINNNIQVIDTTYSYPFDAMQLGPDAKIYVSREGYDYLSIINKPDEDGKNCDYISEGIKFVDNTGANKGLPTFIQSFFKPTASIYANTPLCEGDSLVLSTPEVEGAFYSWTIPPSTKIVDSDKFEVVIPKVTGANAGKVYLAVRIGSNYSYDTLDIVVYAKPTVKITNPADTIVICEGRDTVLTALPNGQDYLTWSKDGAEVGTTESITVNTEGMYVVTVATDAPCVDADTIYVVVAPNPTVTITGGTVVYEGTPLVLTANPSTSGVSYQWDDPLNTTTQTLSVTKAGTYSVIITDLVTGCTGYDSVRVTNGSLTVNIIGDTVMCGNQGVTLSLGAAYKTMTWSTGETTQSINVTQPGTYTVDVVDDDDRIGKATITVHRVDMDALFTGLSGVDFGRVYYGTKADPISLTLPNGTGYDLQIDSITMDYNTPITLKQVTGTPFTWANGSQFTFDFSFEPSDIAVYTDQMTVWFSKPFFCSYSASVRGTGIANLVLSVPSVVRVKVSTKKFDLPVKARLDVSDNKVCQGSFSNITVTYDASSFFPDENAPETTKPISFTKIDDNLEVVMEPQNTFSFTKDPIVVANMRGQIGIGKDGSDILLNPYPKLSSKTSQLLNVVIENGEFEFYGICQPQLSNVVLTDNAAASIHPNPAVGEISLKVYNTSGAHEITFYNTIGEKLMTDNVMKSSDNYSEEFIIDVSSLPSGVYQVVIRTASDVLTKSLVIVK